MNQVNLSSSKQVFMYIQESHHSIIDCSFKNAISQTYIFSNLLSSESHVKDVSRILKQTTEEQQRQKMQQRIELQSLSLYAVTR